MPAKKTFPEDEVAEMYRSGMPWGDIGKHFGVQAATVRNHMRRLGFTSRSVQEAAQQRKAAGRTVSPKYWAGKKRTAESVKKQADSIRGENNHRWKGGVSDPREYRKIAKKDLCARCGSRDRLAIHHKNDDHYDNDPDNLVVLCVSCHSSVHKQAYWDAVKAGVQPPKSNAPIGWGRR